MKAEELMIGDWVFCTYPSIKKPFRVEEIRTVGDNELKIIISDELRLVFQDRYIESIPLTPEILEKNGFELTGVLKNTYSDGDSNYTITIDKNGRGQCDITNHLLHIGVTMEYCGSVHELQHALRLCWVEKKIVI